MIVRRGFAADFMAHVGQEFAFGPVCRRAGDLMPTDQVTVKT